MLINLILGVSLILSVQIVREMKKLSKQRQIFLSNNKNCQNEG